MPQSGHKGDNEKVKLKISPVTRSILHPGRHPVCSCMLNGAVTLQYPLVTKYSLGCVAEVYRL